MNNGKKFGERTGMDTLNTFLSLLSAVFILVTWLTGELWWIVPAGVLAGVFIWRGISGNTEERAEANRSFRNTVPAMGNEWRLLRRKWRDRKEHVYRKCPRCRSVLRFKRAKGERQVVCPHCGAEFRFRIHFGGRKKTEKDEE